METIKVKCRTTTPMFSAGADGKTPEFRASSLKGAMRFWWRAFNLHLPIESTVSVEKINNPGLREVESLIFGGAGFESHEGQRSTFSLQLLGPHFIQETKKLVPHKTSGFEAIAIKTASSFEITLRIPKAYQVTAQLAGVKTEVFNREKLIALLQLTSILGGMGKRVRRGMGSWYIESASINQTLIPLVSNPIIQDIFDLVKILTPHYKLQKDASIEMNFAGRIDNYPWVRTIEIGKQHPSVDSLLSNISLATHTVKEDVTQKRKIDAAYNVSLGHAKSGRFASPIYASVLPDLRTVVTTLNTVPDRDFHLIDSTLQKQFKNSFL